jgi:hypothetical protein
MYEPKGPSAKGEIPLHEPRASGTSAIRPGLPSGKRVLRSNGNICARVRVCVCVMHKMRVYLCSDENTHLYLPQFLLQQLFVFYFPIVHVANLDLSCGISIGQAQVRVGHRGRARNRRCEGNTSLGACGTHGVRTLVFLQNVAWSQEGQLDRMSDGVKVDGVVGEVVGEDDTILALPTLLRFARPHTGPGAVRLGRLSRLDPAELTLPDDVRLHASTAVGLLLGERQIQREMHHAQVREENQLVVSDLTGCSDERVYPESSRCVKGPYMIRGYATRVIRRERCVERMVETFT